MTFRIILAFSTMIGITLASFLAQQAEAEASQNFSRHGIARATFAAEEDSSQSPRKKRKLVKTLTPIKTSQSSPTSMFDLFGDEALPKAASKKQRNGISATAPIKNQPSMGPARRAEIKKWLTAEIKVGDRDARVPMIRAQMVKLGFLSEDNSLAWMLGHPADKVSNPLDLEFILDKELSKAITAFQKGNGIKQSGSIDQATVAALNAPVAAAKQRQAEEERTAQEAALALAKQRQAEEAQRQRLAAEAAEEQRQAKEAERQRLAAEAAEEQRQAETQAADEQRQAEEQRKAQEAALTLAKQSQAAEAERLAAEAAEKKRQAEEAERQRLAAEVAAKQRQAEEVERLAAEAAEKQRQAEETERQRLAAEVAAKQRQAEEAERQRRAAEAAEKQRQAEEERKAQEAALALAKQRQVEEAERQRLAAEVAAKQRQAEEAERRRLAAEVAEKQRQAEEARRLAHNRKVASLDSALGAKETLSKSCNKAKSIIGKWGFEDIETNSCTGKVYHFLATRKGKRFSVKINALTSELTEVKRVLSSAAQ